MERTEQGLATYTSQVAEAIYRKAVAEQASRNATIQGIWEVGRRLAQQVVAGELDAQQLLREQQQVAAASEVPQEEVPPASVESTPLSLEELLEELHRLYAQLMGLVDRHPTLRATKPPSQTIGGFYDGIAPHIAGHVLTDGSDEEVRRVKKHEVQHEKDGLPSWDIDQKLIRATGVSAIDERLVSVRGLTGRNVFERSAMQAEGAPPEGPYLREHWDPTERAREMLTAADLDFELAMETIIKDKDPEAAEAMFHQAAAEQAGISVPVAAGEGSIAGVGGVDGGGGGRGGEGGE